MAKKSIKKNLFHGVDISRGYQFLEHKMDYVLNVSFQKNSLIYIRKCIRDLAEATSSGIKYIKYKQPDVIPWGY